MCFQVCFSDQSVFEILNDKSQYVRHLPGEDYAPECIVKTMKHPVSVMVWSMITVHGVGRRDVVSASTSRSRDGLETHFCNVSVSSRSRENVARSRSRSRLGL